MVAFNYDPRLRTIAAQIENDRKRQAARGHIVTPGESITAAIKRLPTDGGIVWLSEGTHVFYSDLTVARGGVVIRGVSPEKTVIKRDRTSTSPLITFSGTDNVLENFTIKDTSSGVAVKFTGQRSTIRNCVVEDCYGFVEIDGANWCEVINNKVVSSRDKGVNVTGTVAGCVINGNRFISTAAATVYLGDSVSSVCIMGHLFDYSSGSISYLAAADGIPGADKNQVSDSTGGTVRVGLQNLNSISVGGILARSESSLPATEFGENEIIQMRIFSNSSGLSLDGGQR